MESPGGGGGGAGPGADGCPPGAPSFKLRLAVPREPGRSYVSLVKPLGLPAIVTGKFHVRASASDEAADVEGALRRVQAMFERGPRDKYRHAPLSSHEYGWWAWAARPEPPELRHPLRDSPWLKERLRLLPPEPARPR